MPPLPDGGSIPRATGEIILPFTAQPGPQTVLLHDGAGFASLETITLAGEAYSLTGGFHLEREQLLAGGEATLAVRPRLELNGQPVSAKLLEKTSLTLTSTDHDGIATTATVVDFKLHDDRESTHAFKVPDRLASLTVTLSGEVKSLSEAKSIPLSALLVLDRQRHRHGAPGQRPAPRPRRRRMVHRRARQKWRDRSPSAPCRCSSGIATTPLPSASRSRPAKTAASHSGRSTGIARLAATGPNGLTRHWTITPDAVNASSNVHAAAGETVRIATFTRAADASLLEIRGDGGAVADVSAKLAEADGFLEARDLAPGDYQLHLRPEDRVVTLRVTKGHPRRTSFLVSPTRLLESHGAQPLHLPSARVEGDALVIRVANADPLTRVHIAATRYAPELPLAGLGRVCPAVAARRHPGRQPEPVRQRSSARR